MMEMKNILAIGSSDFKELIKNNYFYIDKSMFIKELIDNKNKVVLITRPRRFGKSLNMSMLHHYLNINEDSKELFKDLKIMKEGEKYSNEINSYPVISLSFNGLKTTNIDELKEKLRTIIYNAYSSHRYLLESNKLYPEQKEYIRLMLNSIIDRSIFVDIATSINKLMTFLKLHFDKNVIVLLDEYDVPLINGYEQNFYEDSVILFKDFFSSVFKDNTDLYKGVLTGVSRVSKESIFTDGNNIKVYTMLNNEFATGFGFTEEEIDEVLEKYDLQNYKNKIKLWYDGYNIGSKTDIYNPWSIINFFSELKFKTYWVNTSSNNLIENILRNSTAIRPFLEDLIDKKSVTVTIDSNTVLKNIEDLEENIWGLFLQAGYLKVVKVVNEIENEYSVKLPNFEIRLLFSNLVKKWFSGIKGKKIKEMLNYLVDLDMKNFTYMFQDLCLETLSYMDVKIDTDESFYHAFALGMFIFLRDNYIITSNRESGYGRYDVCLEPYEKNKNAFVIEFKSCKNDSFKEAIEEGKKQIEDKKYAITLKQHGCKNITKMVFAFKGKEVKIEVIK